jgi:hypothetical protein
MDDGSYGSLAALVTFRPLDQRVTGANEPAPFRNSSSGKRTAWTKTVRLLARELEMLRARHAIMMIDFRPQDFRADGIPRADRRAGSPCVVLTFESARLKASMRMVGSRYDRWQDNVRAIALSLEALRAVDRYGVTKTGEQYRGWLALPMGSGVSGSRGVELVAEYGSVRKALHATAPDHGGDENDYRSVLAAREMGMVA